MKTTVKEMIETLSKLPPDSYLFVSGYEDEFARLPKENFQAEFALDVHTVWYYGKHAKVSEYNPYTDKEKVKGFIL